MLRSKNTIFKIKKQDKKIYKCNICDRVFNQKSNLNTHMRIHTGERPFECKECKKLFTTSGNLKSHMSIHTGQKAFTCPFANCGKKYFLAYRLKIHMRIHKNEKPYVCQKCNKSFNEKGNLTIHERIHTGERPYKCNYSNCEARFKTQGHLKDHLTRHYDNRDFKCSLCSAGFKRLTELNKHLMNIHNKKEKILPVEKSNSNTNENRAACNLHINTFPNVPPPTANLINCSNLPSNIFEDNNSLFNDNHIDFNPTNKLYNLSNNCLFPYDKDVERVDCFTPNNLENFKNNFFFT